MFPFHVNPQTGDVSRCRAVNGKCPFGSKNHFLTAAGARAAFESRMAEKHATAIADDNFNNREVNISYTPAEAQQKFENEIQGRKFQLTIKNGGEPGMLLEELFGKDPHDSKPEADLGTVELKTLTEDSLMNHINLGGLKADKGLRQIANLLKEEKKRSLRISANEWTVVGKNKLRIKFDDKSKRMWILVTDESDNPLTSKDDVYWDYGRIGDKVDQKYRNIALVRYKKEEISEQSDQRDVTFTRMNMLHFTRDTFVKKLKRGEIDLQLRSTHQSFSALFYLNL